mgnify:CR=1 FL=1
MQPVIGLFGLLGNILTISVLSTKEMASSFNNLIIALSVFDSIFIIFVTFEYTFVRGEHNLNLKIIPTKLTEPQSPCVAPNMNVFSLVLASDGGQFGLCLHLPKGHLPP